MAAASDIVPAALWLAGLVCVAVGAFLHGAVAGWITLGVELLITGALGEASRRRTAAAAADAVELPQRPLNTSRLRKA